MTDIVFDLATKVLNEDQPIWAVFPGLSRRFLPRFEKEGVIFLEAPAIALNHMAINDDNLLRQHVSMSLAWVSYLAGSDKSPPSRNPDSYDIISSDRSFGAAFGNVRNLFRNVKKGDIVVVGQYDFYSPILIGEVASAFDVNDVTTIARYGEESVPFRKVNWLSSTTQRRHYSQSLSKLLSNRRAIVRISTHEYGPEIFEAAYGDFVFPGTSRYVFDGPLYTNKGTAAVPGIDLISYFCSAYRAIDEGKIEEFALLSMGEAIDRYYDESLLDAFEIEFASPGEYILRAAKLSLPLFVAAMCAVTAADAPYADLSKATITNSIGVAKSKDSENIAVEQEIQERYNLVMKSINYDRFKEWKKKHEAAKKGVGFAVKVRRKR